MKISELIERLEAMKVLHGDVQCRAWSGDLDNIAFEGPVNSVKHFDAGAYPEHIEITYYADL